MDQYGHVSYRFLSFCVLCVAKLILLHKRKTRENTNYSRQTVGMYGEWWIQPNSAGGGRGRGRGDKEHVAACCGHLSSELLLAR